MAELESFGARVDVHDPWVDAASAAEHYGVQMVDDPAPGAYDAVVLAVAHREFREWGSDHIRALGKPGAHVLYDLKYVLDRADSDLRL